MESATYSTAQIYKTAKGHTAVHQVVHYRYRGAELLDYSMDDYASLICIIKKKILNLDENQTQHIASIQNILSTILTCSN